MKWGLEMKSTQDGVWLYTTPSQTFEVSVYEDTGQKWEAGGNVLDHEKDTDDFYRKPYRKKGDKEY